MDLLSPHPLWPVRDGLPAVYPALEEDVRCDVAVIGAGISGALIGWRLAEAGFDTVIVDRREVAHGSTAGNTGLLLYELDEPLNRLARRFGRDFATRAYRRCHRAIKSAEQIARGLKIACEFERRPSLYVAANASHERALRREFEARVAAGIDVEWWPRARIRRESSLPHPAAIWSRDAAQLDAYRFTHGVLAAAARAGARIFDRTCVTRRSVSRHGAVLRTDRAAIIRAGEIVVASGYEAEPLLPGWVTQLQSTFVGVTAPAPPSRGWPPGGCMIWDTREAYLYLRTIADGRVLIGGYDEPFRDSRRRDRVLPRKAGALARRLRELFPDLGTEFEYTWAGTFATTVDGLPVIGRHPRMPRTHFALGYGGNGITFSLIAAEIIPASLKGEIDPDADVFGFARIGK